MNSKLLLVIFLWGLYTIGTGYPPAQASNIKVQTLYKTCSACHGVDGSKSALNISRPIKGIPKQTILNALHGYKTGNYGGEMKALMRGQVIRYNDDDIEKIAEYISNF